MYSTACTLKPNNIQNVVFNHRLIAQNNPHLENASLEKQRLLLSEPCLLRLSFQDLVDHWGSVSTLSSDYRVREGALLGIHNEVYMWSVAIKADSFTALLLLWGGDFPWDYL